MEFIENYIVFDENEIQNLENHISNFIALPTGVVTYLCVKKEKRYKKFTPLLVGSLEILGKRMRQEKAFYFTDIPLFGEKHSVNYFSLKFPKNDENKKNIVIQDFKNLNDVEKNEVIDFYYKEKNHYDIFWNVRTRDLENIENCKIVFKNQKIELILCFYENLYTNPENKIIVVMLLRGETEYLSDIFENQEIIIYNLQDFAHDTIKKDIKSEMYEKYINFYPCNNINFKQSKNKIMIPVF